MATAESAKKVCIVCGADVAGKPRVKDAAGRYMCVGECQAKAEQESLARAEARERAKLQPPPPPKTGPVVKGAQPAGKSEGSLLGDLISSSPMISAVACSACGNPMPAGSVVCTRCGFNSQTGKSLKTAVIKEKEKKDPKIKPQKYSNKYAYQSGPGFWKFFLIYAAVGSALSLLVFGGPTGVWAAIVVMIVMGFATWVACVIAAFRNDQAMWGLLMIIPGVGGIAAFVFNLLFNEDTASRAMYWASLVIGVVFLIMMGVAAALGFNTDLTSQSLSPIAK